MHVRRKEQNKDSFSWGNSELKSSDSQMQYATNVRILEHCYILRSVESFGWPYLTVIEGCVPLLSCYLESKGKNGAIPRSRLFLL
jgi:hypothetical protein